MTKIKIAAALTALTVAFTFALPAKEAEARRWGGVAAGLAIGALAGAAIASSHAHAYPAYGHGYKRCRWVNEYDRFGYYIGKSRVCYYR